MKVRTQKETRIEGSGSGESYPNCASLAALRKKNENMKCETVQKE